MLKNHLRPENVFSRLYSGGHLCQRIYIFKKTFLENNSITLNITTKEKTVVAHNITLSKYDEKTSYQMANAPAKARQQSPSTKQQIEVSIQSENS